MIGEEVNVRGWLHHVRRQGRLIFLVIRDPTGYVQAVIKPTIGKAFFKVAEKLTRETAVTAKGTIKEKGNEEEVYQNFFNGSPNLPTPIYSFSEEYVEKKGLWKIKRRSVFDLWKSEKLESLLTKDNAVLEDKTRLTCGYVKRLHLITHGAYSIPTNLSESGPLIIN